MNVRARLAALLPREGRLWLLASAGLLLTGWIKGINLLMLLAYLMLALWVVNAVAAARQLRGLRARRRQSGPLFAGTEASWEVELTNDRSRDSCGWRIADRGAAHRLDWFLDRIDGHQSIRLRARTVLAQRGRYRLEPLTAACLHPFGLAQVHQVLAPADEWLVLPRLGKLDSARFRRWLARLSRGDGRLRRVARPSMIRQDDLHGLRPFRPGDSPRWIHWRTSARRNEKMVREFEESSGQNLILVLDPWVPHAGASAPDAPLEATISLLATLCWTWSAEKNDFAMLAVAGSRPAVIHGYASRDLAVRMLQALAVVDGEANVDAGTLLQAAGGKVIPDAAVVLVSSRADSPLHNRLAAAWNRPVLCLTPQSAREFYHAPATAGTSAPGTERALVAV